ncbi:enoyl-CoA hydratase [Atopomonas hussainii]|uniref:Enoyl-CoA hydratase n=1 Tax=Atopomonas hussainii TaxID=1429083 RepID=A0A1H7I5N9_9GAMM|nr:crotonase/enoyl-CoA hydratase family protein [Atopomonas hussainii]SEK57152.1 enoyl-CoA hydratase [Atopomonas hussainii]
MSEVVGYQLQDGVAVINLDNGKVNAVSHEVIDGLNKALDQAEADKAVVVLTGKPGILSGGYDLKVMQTSMDAAIGLVTAGSTLARRMLAHPFPIIVACPGHAVAKGAFLLLSADYRIGVAGAFQIGLNEVAIGMTMHHVGIELARGRLTTPAFHRSVINAEMFGPEAAVNAGFLDQVVAPEALMDTAMATAKAMKKLNMRAHKQTKLKSRAEFLATLDKSIALDQDSKLQ